MSRNPPPGSDGEVEPDDEPSTIDGDDLSGDEPDGAAEAATEDEYSPDRETMGWMGMHTPLRAMPGMATDDQLKQLEDARGVDSDKLFLTLMTAHHLGGIPMAEYEAGHGVNPRIRRMANGMA